MARVGLKGIHFAKDQISQRLADVTARVRPGILLRPNDQSALSMTLVAPVGQRPVIGTSRRAEAEWVDNAVTI